MKVVASILVVLSIAVFSGCEKLNTNLAGRAIERAERKVNDKDYRGAVADYEEALVSGPRSAEIHYRLAILYADKLRVPVSALHHFQRCLELSPSGAYSKNAESFAKEAEFRLRTSLLATAAISQAEAVRLKNDNLALRKQVAELKAKPRTAGQGSAPPQTAATPPSGSRTYVVQPGDTLASIARKFYKSSAHWKDIQDANFNALSGTNRLKPGQTLIIPKPDAL